jgi:hypothetical protein
MPKVKLTRAYAGIGGPGEVEITDAEVARRLERREARLNAKAAARVTTEPAVDADGRPSEVKQAAEAGAPRRSRKGA